MNDVLLPDLVRALDLFAIERRPDSSFAPITPHPAWLTPILDSAAGAPITLAQTLPFLENFLREAEVFWTKGVEGRLISGAFTAQSGSEDLLLRASALNLGSRCVMVLEPLRGDADPRPLLQTARDNKLEYERLARQIESVRRSLATISQAARQLLETDLTSSQRDLVQRIEGASARAQTVAAGEQPPERGRG